MKRCKELEEARKTIDDIKNRLDNGEDFDKLMKAYCEDPGITANPDGYVFTYNEMIPEFEKAAFALKEGEISDIVETNYGYHIIKREELPPMDDTAKSKLVNAKVNALYEKHMIEGSIVEHMTFDELAELLVGNSLIAAPEEK